MADGEKDEEPAMPKIAQIEIRGGKQTLKGDRHGGNRGESVVAHATIDARYYAQLNRHSWSLNRNGYPKTRLLDPNTGKRPTIKMNQIVWSLAYGDPPKKPFQIDHKNRDPLDNRAANLREVPRSVQCALKGKRRDNTSGFKDVFWCKLKRKWKAQVKVNKKNLHFGYFDSPLEAARAVNAAYRRYFPDVEIPNPEAE